VRDLVRGLKQPEQGSHGLIAAQVLRALVLMRSSALMRSISSCTATGRCLVQL